MTAKKESVSLHSRVIETKLLNWRDFQFIQQDNLKEIPWSEKERLKASILSNNFTQPFYVWQEPATGVVFCLDGKHRTRALDELSLEGFIIPDYLPATLIECQDKKEAANLVLIYSSMYARMSETGLFDFIQLYDLDMELLLPTIDIPNIDMVKFGGDLGRDFSILNQELEIESFKDEIVMKFTFSKESYGVIKQRINELMTEYKLSTFEELFKQLLFK